MSIISSQQSNHISPFKNHAYRTDFEILKETSSQEAQDWVHDALGFFSGHQNYDQCKDELEGYFLNVFGAEGKQAQISTVSPLCRELVCEYRINDFLLGISARFIKQHGKEKGAQLAKAFQRVWHAGTNPILF